eukprot:NODE_210_length_2305_cov_58.274564_g204_i0.p1 GENE.NODE_210_length_2305_cov_58.274564_g204_i0~~NODE_210_length_2305_cov_58.274564_g204_i0.p1  ORF type:complete len:600 (-),score=127.38 NODE_210_length_2305_cov_58.274564_g204_i0:432-2231(-)
MTSPMQLSGQAITAKAPRPPGKNRKRTQGRSARREPPSQPLPPDTSRVLILYTGGTIGMKTTAKGYAPEAGFLPSVMRQSPTFQDPAFKESITPPSYYGKRCKWDLIEYEPLLDSSDMDMDDWARIAGDIHKYYSQYDGFLVLHGTDTMAYTASALSFMLENLGKTVILTGSQIPLSEQRNDGTANLLGALIVASHYVIPEVCVYFQSRLLRGCRCSKIDSAALDAFDSVNIPPLGTIGVGIKVDWNRIWNPTTIAKFAVSLKLVSELAVVPLFPGITPAAVRAAIMACKGAVLKSYGAGNAPLRPELLDVFRAARDAGIVVVNTTQCNRGGVKALYETGVALKNVGVVPGSDMTVEAAVAKLAYLLGKGLDVAAVRKQMEENLRGELTVQAQEQFSLQNNEFVSKVAAAVGSRNMEEANSVTQALAPTLMCAAAGNGDITSLQEMVSAGSTVTVSDYDKRTPLHLACAEGHLDCVRWLLEHGACVHTMDRFQRTALMDALLGGHEACALLLREAGAALTENQLALCKAFDPGTGGQHLATQRDEFWSSTGSSASASLGPSGTESASETLSEEEAGKRVPGTGNVTLPALGTGAAVSQS